MPSPGTFFPPPPPRMGSHQPHAQRKLAPQLLDTNPPAKGGQLWVGYPDTTSALYTRFRRTLPPSVLDVTPDRPPVTHPGRRIALNNIIRAWQPPPPNPHMGERQALRKRQLAPSLLNRVPDPPTNLGHQGRTVEIITQIARAWAPPPPQPYIPPPQVLPPEPPAPPAPTSETSGLGGAELTVETGLVRGVGLSPTVGLTKRVD